METALIRDTIASPNQRILCIFPQLTNDLAKSAHLLILRHVASLGCEVVVLTLGSADEEVGCADLDWNGLHVRRLVPRSRRWHWLQRLYQWRRISGKSGLNRKVARLLNPVLLPLTALFSFPDAHVAAGRELLAAAQALHASKAFNVVLTLYYPLSSHFVGQQFAREVGIPWLALTKDFYSWPDAFRRGVGKQLANRFKRWFEPRAYRGASALVSISQYMNDYYSTLSLGIPLEVLGHCYDEQAYPALRRSPTGPRPMTLVCVGLTQPADVPTLKILFRSVAMMIEQDGLTRDDLSLRFVGHNGRLVQQVAREVCDESLLTIVGAVNHAAAMKELKQADCLFYIQTLFGTRRRLTEYLGAQRPVLACPRVPGELSEILLTESGAGDIVDSTEEMVEVLRRMVKEFHAAGCLEKRIDQQYVARHSAKHRALELVEILAQYSSTVDGNTPAERILDQRA